MKLIVGLGNPGPDYARTRHNAGFMVVDRLAARHNITQDRSRFQGLAMDAAIGGARCLLLKPMTYMNRSGQSVREAMNFYKVEPDDVLVVVDETALPVGTIRLRPNGSAGGHNGLADIEQKLGTQQYARLRIGVNHDPRIAKKDYVLGRFSKEDLDILGPTIERACDCVECWMNDDIDAVMTRYNA